MFGRKVPKEWTHVEKYPLKKLGYTTVEKVNKVLRVPKQYTTIYDQRRHNACVGFSTSLGMSIYNQWFRRPDYYDGLWLYAKACELDGDPETSLYADVGTYLFAAFDVLRKLGHVMLVNNSPRPVDRRKGILSNYWCTTTDEVRTAISLGRPVILGTNWYRDFSYPEKYKGNYWIGRSSYLGSIDGGHAYALVGARDDLGAFKIVNTWGPSYPPSLMPYELLERLLGEDGEAGVAIDLPGR